MPRHIVLLKSRRVGLTHARASLAPMASTALRRQLPPGRRSEVCAAIVQTCLLNGAQAEAGFAHYFTPTAAIEESQPCA